MKWILLALYLWGWGAILLMFNELAPFIMGFKEPFVSIFSQEHFTPFQEILAIVFILIPAAYTVIASLGFILFWFVASGHSDEPAATANRNLSILVAICIIGAIAFFMLIGITFSPK